MRKPRALGRGLATAIIALLALAAVLAVGWSALRSDSAVKGGLSAGMKAPAIEGMDTSGARIDLLDYRGQPIIVNFWASWCGPCVKEMPVLDEVYRSAYGRYKLISVNVGDTKGTVNEFLTEHDISFPVLIDAAGKASGRYRVSALPATFVIDMEGRIIHAGLGQITEAEQLYSLLGSDE